MEHFFTTLVSGVLFAAVISALDWGYSNMIKGENLAFFDAVFSDSNSNVMLGMAYFLGAL